MQQVLLFLAALQENNNREWFEKNRKWYQECREKMLFMTEIVINEVRKFDPAIPVMDPNECLFRIFRDVRFSGDKRPYKTNMGSFIAKGGRKSAGAGYYFHVEPGECFAGGGIYMPESEPLKAIRQHIFENPERFSSIVEDEQFRNLFPDVYGNKLKTAPKGFPKDFEYIGYLKYTSYAYGAKIDDELVSENLFFEKILEIFKKIFQLNLFLNEALEK